MQNKITRFDKDSINTNVSTMLILQLPLKDIILLFYLFLYIFLTKPIKMQLQHKLEKRTRDSICLSELQNMLGRQISEMLENGKRATGESLFLVSISSRFSLKLQYKILGSIIVITGLLIYSNGENVLIPSAYRSILLNTLKKENRIHVKFQFFDDMKCLTIRSGTKFNPVLGAELHQISTCLAQLSTVVPDLKKALYQIGLHSQISSYSIKFKKAKLTLIRSITDSIRSNTVANQLQLDFKGTYSVFKECDEIVEIENFDTFKESGAASTIKKGGYFQIQRKKCQIKNGSEVKVIDLAVKTLKKSREKSQFCRNKIKKQQEILSKIVDNKYFLSYYRAKEDGDQEKKERIFMDYVEDTLDYHIYCRNNKIEEILDFFQQIIEGVKVLQKSGIAHRDLKPENFLVQTKGEKEGEGSSRILKIIDFGQSALFSDKFNNSPECSLGSTIPYSPLQCYSTSQEGFNSQQIDLWSIGILMYQLLQLKNPLTFSRCFATDILRGWKMADQFSTFLSHRKKRGVRVIEEVVSILTINTVCVKQSERLGIHKLSSIVSDCQKFIKSMQH